MSSNGVNIHQFITESIEKLGLSVGNIIASCTDGANNMRSEMCGISGLLQKGNKYHIFTWCVCHRYNLFVEDSIVIDKGVQELLSQIHSFGVSEIVTKMNKRVETCCNLFS